MHSKNTTKNRLQQFRRHKKYLNRIKCTSLYCPRYDMLSLSNNLLLHRNFNPKLDLVPKKQSQEISQLQHQITTKKTTNKPQSMERRNWFDEIINKNEESQGKFKVKYEAAGYEVEKVRSQLNKLYNTSRGSFSQSKSKNLTLYDQLPKLGSFLN